MSDTTSIHISSQYLHIDSDAYALKRIERVEAKSLNWKDNLVRLFVAGLVVSSLLFPIIPASTQEYGLPYAQALPIVGFLVGMVIAQMTCAKSELRIEYKHSDGTGLQWLTVMRSRNPYTYFEFKEKAKELNSSLCAKAMHA